MSAVWAGLDAHAALLRAGDAVIAGDFNSHPRWDGRRARTHTALTRRLHDEFGLVSAWHASAGEDAPEPATHYHQWRADRGFHIDYCFVPRAWADRVTAFIPDEAPGSRHSDHRPLVIDMDGFKAASLARPEDADPGSPSPCARADR